MHDLYDHVDSINALLARNGVRFGIYKNGVFKEQLFPFDPIPRIITKDEFDYIDKGLKQRVTALNRKNFLCTQLSYFLRKFCSVQNHS